MSYLTQSEDSLLADVIAGLEDQGFAYNPLTTSLPQYLAICLGDPTAYKTKSVAQMLAELNTEFGGSVMSHLTSSVAQLLSALDETLASPSYSAEAEAYFARLITQPTAARKAIYDALFVGLVGAGIFPKLDALYILRAAREQWAYENLVQSAYWLTPHGGYTFTADEHWQGNGTTGYLSTAFVPSTAGGHLSQNDAHVGVTSRSSAADAGVALHARTAASHQISLGLRSVATGQSTMRINQTTGGAVPASASAAGRWVLRRSGSAADALFKDAVLVTNDTAVSTGLPAFEIVIGATNSSGTIANFASHQFADAQFGGNLSDADISAIKTLMDAFYTAIAAQPELDAGGSDPQMHPSTSVFAYGDSLTASAFTTRLATALPRTVTNRGIGGQRSFQISMRQGGNVPTVTISGNQIVDGSNSITHFNGTAIAGMAASADLPQMLSSPADNTGRTIKASIAGVVGTITRASSGGPPSTSETYTFTPDADPGTVSCPALTPVVVQTQTESASTQIIWVGRNDKILNNWSVVDEVQRMADQLSTFIKHYVVLSITNGNYENEFSGQSYYNDLVASNAELASAFPDSYLDVRRYLIDDGLTDASITPTSQDLIDIANDTVPASLRSDDVHLTTVGYQLVADHVATFMLGKGW
ncbi:hypothetical protein [Mesorhizobium sp.]|uniref:SGNH/GDSL hydrolase family protein n=1 Tax=Mesorhizobium sp. TaxID=1871066 RepID=UPI000FE96C66|nr:hypothetical protein [Mesorhizobium sp.]RWN33440.1 MAG: SGNH/GDSL hydrolase family protein [Mesorhizobium sp.]